MEGGTQGLDHSTIYLKYTLISSTSYPVRSLVYYRWNTILVGSHPCIHVCSQWASSAVVLDKSVSGITESLLHLLSCSSVSPHAHLATSITSLQRPFSREMLSVSSVSCFYRSSQPFPLAAIPSSETFNTSFHTRLPVVTDFLAISFKPVAWSQQQSLACAASDNSDSSAEQILRAC